MRPLACLGVSAGLTSDANILIQYVRLVAQRHTFAYGEPMPLEQLVQAVADYKHGYTQHGGLRPFGCSFLFGGWDEHYGFQLFQTDPSGNFSGWKATAIGANSPTAVSTLKKDYDPDMSLADAGDLAVKVLAKALDTTHPTAERMEVVTITRDKDTGAIVQRMMSAAEVTALIAKVVPAEAGAASGGAGAATASM